MRAIEKELTAIPQIGRPGEPHIFNLREAMDLLPLVRKITLAAQSQWQPERELLRNTLTCDPRLEARAAKYASIVQAWSDKIERLGPVVAGLWHVDFFTGDGFLCWRYPEIQIAYFHEMEQGIKGRQAIIDVIETQAPDWAWID